MSRIGGRLARLAGNRLLDGNFQRLVRMAIGAQGDEPVVMLVEDRPEGVAIGLRQIDVVDGFAGKKAEASLIHRGRQMRDRSAAVKEKQQPVRGALVGLFGDHCKQVEIIGADDVAGFLGGFARGAFEGGLAEGGFEFAADGTPGAEIRWFGAEQQEVFSGGILQENQDGDFVIHGGVEQQSGRMIQLKRYAWHDPASRKEKPENFNVTEERLSDKEGLPLC